MNGVMKQRSLNKAPDKQSQVSQKKTLLPPSSCAPQAALLSSGQILFIVKMATLDLGLNVPTVQLLYKNGIIPSFVNGDGLYLHVCIEKGFFKTHFTPDIFYSKAPHDKFQPTTHSTELEKASSVGNPVS